MSMPNIPDVVPDIHITLDEAVNLLLSSIAMEEVSISKLMDAETEKLKAVLCQCPCGYYDAGEMTTLNNSINSTVMNLIKMQMLLQFKLENVERLVPKTPPCPPHPPCPIHPICSVSGSGHGDILRPCDEFCGAQAELSARVCCGPGTDACCVHYRAAKTGLALCMDACPHTLHIECPRACEPEGAVITGEGTVLMTFMCGEERTENVEFQMTVWDRPPCRYGFRITMRACRGEFYHDSGFVAIEEDSEGFQIERCMQPC